MWQQFLNEGGSGLLMFLGWFGVFVLAKFWHEWF